MGSGRLGSWVGVAVRMAWDGLIHGWGLLASLLEACGQLFVLLWSAMLRACCCHYLDVSLGVATCSGTDSSSNWGMIGGGGGCEAS